MYVFSTDEDYDSNIQTLFRIYIWNGLIEFKKSTKIYGRIMIIIWINTGDVHINLSQMEPYIFFPLQLGMDSTLQLSTCLLLPD